MRILSSLMAAWLISSSVYGATPYTSKVESRFQALENVVVQ